MKILPVLHFGNTQVKFNNNTKKAEISELNANYSKVDTNVLKAYKMNSINRVSFGGAILEKIKFDDNKLTYQIPIRATKPATTSVSVTYQTSTERGFNPPVTEMATEKNGEFELSVSAIDRKTNLYKNINIIDILFHDETGKLIDKKSYDKGKMSINAKNAIPKAEKILDFNGKQNKSDFYVVTGAKNEGIIKRYSTWADLKRNTENNPIIAYLDDLDGFIIDVRLNDSPIPKNVKGIFALNKAGEVKGFLKDALGHVASRMRDNKQAFVLLSPEANKQFIDTYVDKGDKILSLDIDEDLNKETISIKEIDKLTPKKEQKVVVPKFKLVNRVMKVDDPEFSVETVGLKAYNLKRLKNMKNRKFQVPKFVVIPAGMIDKIKKDPINNDVYGKDVKDFDQQGTYHGFVQQAEKQHNPEASLAALRNLVENNITIPKNIRDEIDYGVESELGKLDFNINDLEATLAPTNKEQAQKQLSRCLIARSSFNGEDSATFATQGIYASIPGIRDKEQLYRGIKHVWASKWKDLAFETRRENNIDHRSIQPNVIIQNVVPVDYTYTIYTANPKTRDKNKILIQLSQGIDCNMAGTPYFFEYDKTTKEARRLVLADKGRIKTLDQIVMDDPLKEKHTPADYSNDVFNKTKADYTPVIKKIAEVAMSIEKEFGGIPQDIEGGIKFIKKGTTDSKLYVWQTRDAHLFD